MLGDTPGPASSCSAGEPSSSNPCCTVLSGYKLAINYLLVEYGFITYPAGTHICMEGDPANTVGAQRSQDQINELTSLFDARDCWGGQIAMSPGATVKNLLGSQDYARRLQRMSCDVNFRVDGDWSGWNSWSACQSGTINSTRSRTCNNPFLRQEVLTAPVQAQSR